MANKAPQSILPFDSLLQYESFTSILRSYVDLNCNIVTTEASDNWHIVNQHQRLVSIFDLEKKYGLTRKLNEVDNPYFKTAFRENRTVLGEYLGYYDLFVPISRKGRYLGMLLTGVFALEEPTLTQLEKSWFKISGQAAAPENSDFREFVRIALDTPVLQGEVFKAFQEALELFARILAGETRRKEGNQRLKELTLKAFSKQLPHGFWLDWALGRSSRYVMPTWSLDAQEYDWVKSEIGIQRIPTTVITAIPVKSLGKKTDAVEEMIRIRRFQGRSFHFAKTLPQTVGGKLENYGAVFVTSAEPGQNRLQRRRQIEETARRIHRFAVGELGGAALMGIGGTVAPGDPLNESYRQAVLALHLGRRSGKALVFFRPSKESKTEGLLELKRLLSDLNRAFIGASFSDLEVLRDEFLKLVLTLSFQAPEEIRWHLQYALMQLMETVKNRKSLGEREANHLYENLALTMERAGTTQEMVLAFQEALSKLSQRMAGKENFITAYSIEKVRDYIDEHFREPLRIGRLAKIAKVSVSTFSRRFKKLTGVGLEPYLQNLRIADAKRLLKTGNLPVFQIGRDNGFKSNSYFVQLFKKKTGLSPQKFRRKFQRV